MCRVAKLAYQRSEVGRAVDAKYRNSEKGRSVTAAYYIANKQSLLKRMVDYQQSEKGRAASVRYRRSLKYRDNNMKYRLHLKELCDEVLGTVCAWKKLGGCGGPLCIDHIIPVWRRRTSGYASKGKELRVWVIDHPQAARRKLQRLCETHNNFKSNLPDDIARAKWAAKYPAQQQIAA